MTVMHRYGFGTAVNHEKACARFYGRACREGEDPSELLGFHDEERAMGVLYDLLEEAAEEDKG